MSIINCCDNGDGTKSAARWAYGRDPGRYTRYANGDPGRDLFGFLAASAGRYAHADRIVWARLRDEIDRIVGRTSPGRTIRILDAGSGDGTWSIRLADYLEGLGRRYSIRGLDLTPELIRRGEEGLTQYQASRGRRLNVRFEEGDLERTLPYETGRFDLTLTLYTVLNHIRRDALKATAAELLRVTRTGGRHFTVVKAPGGEPTAYVCDLADVKDFRQEGDRMVIVEHDGDEHSLIVNLIPSARLRDLFHEQGGSVVDLFGIDLFLGPILGRPRASAQCRLPGEESAAWRYFARLDEAHCRDPEAINYAGHIGIVVEPRSR
jgi:SAM-dependent methyltransferase